MAKEKSPAFQFYPSDFLSDRHVLYMSMERRGIYITLLSLCWTDGSISDDAEYHAEGLRASVPDVEAVLKMFRPSEDGEHPKTLTHKRLDEERSKQKSFRKARSDAGKKGGRPPTEKQKKPKLPAGKAKPKQKKALQSSSPSIESTPKSKERDSLSQPVEGDYSCVVCNQPFDSPHEGLAVLGGGWRHRLCDPWGRLPDGDSAKQGGDALEPGTLERRQPGQPDVTGGGSQAEAGPPPRTILAEVHYQGRAKPSPVTDEAPTPRTLDKAYESSSIAIPGSSVKRLEGPTEDPLFNRLHAWFTSERIGGSCKNLQMALQQFMSMREVLIEKLRWNPRTFEESWVTNGWDAAFAAGRQTGELEYWLRDYDPDGTVGKWEKRGADKSRRARVDDARPLAIHEKCGKPQGTCECFDGKKDVSPQAKSDAWQKRNAVVVD